MFRKMLRTCQTLSKQNTINRGIFYVQITGITVKYMLLFKNPLSETAQMPQELEF